MVSDNEMLRELHADGVSELVRNTYESVYGASGENAQAFAVYSAGTEQLLSMQSPVDAQLSPEAQRLDSALTSLYLAIQRRRQTVCEYQNLV